MKQTRQGLIKFGCINTYTFVRLSTKDAGEGITEKKTIHQFTFLALKSKNTDNPAI